MNTKVLKIIGGAVGVVGVIFLVYVMAPFFITKRIDEVAPLTETQKENTKNQEGEIGVATEVPTSAIEKLSPVTPAISSPVVSTKGHPAEGQVKIVSSGDKQYIRYENFKTINGPDLVVYLSKDLDAKEYVSLGKLKATEGNINYEIPSGVNVDDYKYALVWCDAFSVLFNYSQLR